MQLKKAIELFLEGYFSTCQRSEKTIRAYETDLRQFRYFVGGRKRLVNVNAEDLEAWARELKEAEYASASIRRKFAALKVFFNYWARKDRLDKSPVWKVRLDLAPERKLVRTLTEEEVRALLRTARKQMEEAGEPEEGVIDRRFLALRNAAIVEILFATGIRVGELAALRMGDYLEEEGIFMIKGKGGRERIAVLPDAETKNIVDNYAALRESMAADHDLVFVNLHGSSLSTQGVANVVSRAAEAAEVARRVTPHMLRHTIATLLLRNGANLRSVQEFLGHSSISTTQRYTFISNSNLIFDVKKHYPNIST